MRRAAAAVLLGLLAAGCATSGSGAAPSPSPSSVSPTAPGSSASSAPAGPAITVDGVVERGVEPGCLVLRTGAASYLLVRDDGGRTADDVPVAVPVRVRGQVLTGIASYCQQGTPLRVDTVTRR
jgi:hypothetical protein